MASQTVGWAWIMVIMSSMVPSRLQHGGGFRKNFRGERADDVDAENLAIFFFGDDFDEAAMVAEDGGFAVADEGKLAGFDGVARVFGLLFGEADGADLRLAISGVGNARVLRSF